MTNRSTYRSATHGRYTATAPSAWAAYLINGDHSGLPERERAAADRWVKTLAWGAPVSCSDAGFVWRHDAFAQCPYGADCQTYVFYES